jgi:pimeloyl-ACP methyl ester carboxylesterase
MTRVCAFDRAGMGWSDAGPQPRTSRRIADELHTLLHEANIPQPYLLVGHSFGGMNMRVYAATYPQEVAGLVLVDAPNEAEIECLPSSPGATIIHTVRSAAWYLAAIFGLVRLAMQLGLIAQDMSNYPEDLQPLAKWLYAQPKAVKTSDDEELVAKKSCAQVRATRPFLKYIPLVVISSGKKGIDSPLMAYQRELASISAQGKHIIAVGSGHLIQFERPELVVQTIKDMLRAEESKDVHESSIVLQPLQSQELNLQCSQLKEDSLYLLTAYTVHKRKRSNFLVAIYHLFCSYASSH